MSEETRLRILEKGAAIVHRKGFNNTGLKEILEAAQVPKGSFYYYFKSKEDFGVQLVDYYSQRMGQSLAQVLVKDGRSARERFQAFFDWFMSLFAACSFSQGCPLGNLAQEMGDLSPAIRVKLAESSERLSGVLAGVITEGQAEGSFRNDLDPLGAARFVTAAWQGAAIHMKLAQGPGPLENCRSMVLSFLDNPQQGEKACSN